MKQIGAVFRWLLNINSIWGLMIVSAFVMTAYKHTRPISSSFDASLWQRGENQVALTVVGKDGKVFESKYSLALGDNGIVIPEEYKKAGEDMPYLIALRDAGAKTTLVWKCRQYGQYTLTVNGRKVIQNRQVVTLQGMSDAALGLAKVAFNLGLGLVSVFVLFLGLMKVGEDAGVVRLAAKVIRPFIRILFPDVPADHPANGAILMNVTTSMLGLGNAATPFGLKAMEELQKLNPNKDIASDSQIMMMAWNTAGWSIIPMTIIAVRQSAGSSRPYDVIISCLIGGFCATLGGVVACKLFGKVPAFRVEAAKAEEAVVGGPAPDPQPDGQPPQKGSK